MSVAVGIDVAKEVHWAAVKVAETGKVIASHKVDNTPADIGDPIDEISSAANGHGPVTVGVDVLGGIASLLVAMLVAAEITVVHVSGLAVNRARRGTVGGEHKSDPKDAAVIADQVRMHDNLRPVLPDRDIDVELRLLTVRRRELVEDQPRRANRIRDLLTSIHPGLDRVVNVTTKTGLHLLTRYVTPTQIRTAGRRRILKHLSKVPYVAHTRLEALATAVVDSARDQQITVPGEAMAAELIGELAGEALHGRDQLIRIDERIEALLHTHTLTRPSSAACRGWGRR